MMGSMSAMPSMGMPMAAPMPMMQQPMMAAPMVQEQVVHRHVPVIQEQVVDG